MSEIVGDATIDITKPPNSVKVGLDRDELQAEFERMAQEDEGESDKQRNDFMEAVRRLREHESLTPGQQADVLETLRDSGGENPRAWEYFFQEGCHRSLLVLMNSSDFGEEVKRLMKALKVWEIIFEFVGKIPDVREQDLVYRELRREGMVETLLRLMKKYRSSNEHTLQRKAFYFLYLMIVKEREAAARKKQRLEKKRKGELDENEEEGEEDEDMGDESDKSVVERMRAEGEVLDVLRNIEGNSSYYTEDILKKVGTIRRLFERLEGIEPADGEEPKQNEKLPAKPKKPAPPTSSSSPTASHEPSQVASSHTEEKRPTPTMAQRQPPSSNNSVGQQHHPQTPHLSVGTGSETDPLLRISAQDPSGAPKIPFHHTRSIDEAGCCASCVVS